MDTSFNIARIVTCTRCEGPGKRLAIWFQGCRENCLDCCNPGLKPLVAKNIISLEKLAKIIKNSKENHDIEGVTYLGGEPTLQHYLPFLSKVIHEMGLGIIAFTGRNFEEVKECLQYCDMVIDGPYIPSLHSRKRRIIGSDNQRIILLTARYGPELKWFEDEDSIIGEFHLREIESTSTVYNGSATF